MAKCSIASSIRSSYRARTASSSDRKAEARCSSVAGEMSEAAANRLSCSRCQKKLAMKDERIIKAETVQKIIRRFLRRKSASGERSRFFRRGPFEPDEGRFLRRERDRLGSGLAGSGIGVSMAAKTTSVGSSII